MGNNGSVADDAHDRGGSAAETPPRSGAVARTRVTRHAYLGAHPSQGDALGYLESLLTVAVEGQATSDKALGYLKTLAASFGISGFDGQVDSLDALAPSQNTPELLRRVGAGWPWLADATFVLFLGGQPDAAARQDICAVACKAGLPQDAVAQFTGLIVAIAAETDATRVLADACTLSQWGGDAWKAIVDYRGLSFHEALRGLRSSLASIDTIQEAVHLSLDMTGERWKVLDCMSGIPDEGIAVRVAVAANRQVRLSKFGTFNRKVADFVARDKAMLDEARQIARVFGLQVKASRSPRPAAVADGNASYGNQAWSDHMDQAYGALQATLDDHDEATADAFEQIARIADGRW